jgi:hypothetical protein
MQPLVSVIMTGETGDTYAFETPSPSEGLVVVETPSDQAVPR